MLLTADYQLTLEERMSSNMNAALLHSLMSLALILSVIGHPEINVPLFDHVKPVTAIYVYVNNR